MQSLLPPAGKNAALLPHRNGRSVSQPPLPTKVPAVGQHSFRNLNRSQHIVEYAIGIEAFQFSLGTQYETVTQSR
jgi:hypothetical protein